MNAPGLSMLQAGISVCQKSVYLSNTVGRGHAPADALPGLNCFVFM